MCFYHNTLIKMVKFLTLSEKLDFFDKISTQKDEKEIEKLFDYIELIENQIKEYELNINLLLNVYNKNNHSNSST